MQFSAYRSNNPSSQFAIAIQFLNYGTYTSIVHREVMEILINTVIPIYNRVVPDITGGAFMFYSPRYMVPRGSSPRWGNDFERIHAGDLGPDGWYFRFFR